jgi:hypothetical protein
MTLVTWDLPGRPCGLVRQRIRAGALVPPLPDQPGFLYDAYALTLQVRLAVDALAAALPKFMTRAQGRGPSRRAARIAVDPG